MNGRSVRHGKPGNGLRRWPAILAGLTAWMLCGLLGGPAHAQTGSQLGPLPPKPPQLPVVPPPAQPPGLDLPTPTPPGALDRAAKGPKIMVKDIRLVGNTAFTAQQLSEITAPYTNRELAAEDLEALRLALTYYYVNHGYLTSGAVVPEQDVADGTLTMQIIEGKITQVNVEDTKWFRPSYFQSRLNLAAGPPLHVEALQERLRVLQANPRIERINAELLPGATIGENTLNVKVKEANPLKAWLEFNNYQSPVVGAEQGFVTLAHQNLLGFGDTLSLQYGRSAGVNPMLNFKYEIPVGPRDTTVALQYRRFDFGVEEAPFDSLDIKNKAQIFGVSVRHPVIRKADQELAFSLTGEHARNESTLGGNPFELITGAPNGKFRVTALRFGQEYAHRSAEQVISLLSRLSVGIGAMGATANGDPNLPDARFFSWLGEAQWIRQLPLWRTQLVSRGVVQLSNDHLFPLEQIAVGGRYSVRGYREFTLIRDNAAMLSIEARVPVYTTKAGVDSVFLAPFFDLGHGWQTTAQTPGTPPKTLASLGAGVIWNFWRGSHFELYYGKQLKRYDTDRNNLQDHGIHLQLVVEAF
ncbi:MAG: ShlB/FhaC/HecB family hemolysin secretion/activation protein [Nitrospira sp.]|nr:ShlB/FhaC/HecB family hemolysin secretion/activation protein [Nitrospira sp.]